MALLALLYTMTSMTLSTNDSETRDLTRMMLDSPGDYVIEKRQLLQPLKLDLELFFKLHLIYFSVLAAHASAVLLSIQNGQNSPQNCQNRNLIFKFLQNANVCALLKDQFKLKRISTVE